MKRKILTKLTGLAVTTSLLLTVTACSSQDTSSDAGSAGSASSSVGSEDNATSV